MKFLNVSILGLSLLLLSQPSFGSRCNGKAPDLSLVLAIDSSGSVDHNEMQLQMQGYESAFSSQKVQDNLLNCGCTEFSVVSWSTNPTLAFGPATVDDASSIEEIMLFFKEESDKAVQDKYLVEQGLQGRDRSGGNTQIDNAIRFSRDHLLNLPNKAHKMSIIISGDGLITGSHSNAVINKLRKERDLTHENDITISGVTIESRDAHKDIRRHNQIVRESGGGANVTSYTNLADFYKKEVITPYGFVEDAQSFLNFGTAIEKSLKRETCNMMM